MYCSNCGNKVDKNAYICVNCGTILKKNSSNKECQTQNNNVFGIVSIGISIMAILFCLNGFIFGDITDVGMYTHVYERVFFAIGYNLIQIVLAIISLVLGLINARNKYNKIGIGISFVSIFLIVTEFIVILIY